MRTPKDSAPILSSSELIASSTQPIMKTPFPSGLQRDVYTKLVGLVPYLQITDDLELVRLIEQRFQEGIDGWARLGLFTPQREAMGFSKPEFEIDCKPKLTPHHLKLIRQGFDIPVYAPDLQIPFEKAGETSYVHFLREGISSALQSRIGEKAPGKLLIGSEKHEIDDSHICQGDKVVSLSPILRQYYNAHKLISNTGSSSERNIGGTIRFESGQFFRDAQPQLPTEITGQNFQQALAYTIYSLSTKGLLPDFDEWLTDDEKWRTVEHQGKMVTAYQVNGGKHFNSTVALATDTLIHSEGCDFVPAVYWNMNKELKSKDHRWMNLVLGVENTQTHLENSGWRAGFQLV